MADMLKIQFKFIIVKYGDLSNCNVRVHLEMDSPLAFVASDTRNLFIQR